MERRGLFEKVFGKKTGPPSSTRFELISSSDTSFTAWNGNLFANDIVRSCIRPKANAVGKLNAKHISGTGEGMKINKASWVMKILRNPNPYMSMQDFLSKMTVFHELSHNAMAYVQRDNGGYPVAIYPMPYSSAEMVESGGVMFVKFRFKVGKFVVIPYEDVIHLRKDYNENDIFGDPGTAALTGLMEVINTTDQGIVNAVKTSAVLKWIMKFAQVLKPADVQVQVSEFTERYLSMTNVGGVVTSDPRYTLDQVKNENYIPNAPQMDRAIQRLFSYFGVNDAIVQNKYNEDQFNAFYESEIEPLAIKLSNAFTRAFFTEHEQAYGNRIVFESSNLAYASMKTKLGLVAMVDRGALTPNEWRLVLNMGPIEDGDKPLRRLDTKTVGAETEITEGDNDADEPT